MLLNHLARKLQTSTLSVSYKSSDLLADLYSNIPDAVIITDPNFIITGFNIVAENIYGIAASNAIGSLIFDVIKCDITPSALNNIVRDLYKNGYWNGDMMYHQNDKKQFYNTRYNLIKDSSGKECAIVVVNHNISERVKQEKDVVTGEQKFQRVIEAMQDAIILINADGTVTLCNNQLPDILGLSEDTIQKNLILGLKWKITRDNGSEYMSTEFPALHTLKTGEKFDNLLIALKHDNGSEIWMKANINPTYRKAGGRPDAVVVCLSVMAEAAKNRLQNVQKDLLLSKFINNSSALEWICDEYGNIIYGNAGFMKALGMNEKSPGNNLQGFAKNNNLAASIGKRVTEVLATKNTITTEEVVTNKNGDIRHYLSDCFLIPQNNSTFLVGGHAMDITDRKITRNEPEADLLSVQIQKHKKINLATIKAQEKERNWISAELHDNVNQLLMSARLHIGVAKDNPADQHEILDQASEYLLMAVEEIRALSRTLNSTVVSKVGFQKSIQDIANNMQLSKQVEVQCAIDEELAAKISSEQQLMIFRIIQEQSNNILKYADATKAVISLRKLNNSIELVVSDNGKGFNKKAPGSTGIGFINIYNRVDAYNGEVEIISSPGNGCTLKISIPIVD